MITCTFASATESLPESDHDYANNFNYIWPAITEPNATQIRLHFAKIDLNDASDHLYLLDENGNKLFTYYGYTKEDFWTEWYAGNTFKIKLETNVKGTAYGFKIDKIETRP